MIRPALLPCGLLVALLIQACATQSPDPVRELVSERVSRDGTVVELSGILRSNHGLLNLYARNGRTCVGLLMRNEEIARYQSLAGRMITLSGTLHAEGCGRDGICDEDLCGPAVLGDVRVSAAAVPPA